MFYGFQQSSKAEAISNILHFVMGSTYILPVFLSSFQCMLSPTPSSRVSATQVGMVVRRESESLWARFSFVFVMVSSLLWHMGLAVFIVAYYVANRFINNELHIYNYIGNEIDQQITMPYVKTSQLGAVTPNWLWRPR